MIVVVLLCAVVFYAVLYLAWETTQHHLVGVEAWTRAIYAMIWMPDNLVFLIFRGLIIVSAFYVAADALVSAVRRTKRYGTERREKQILKSRKKGVKTSLGWKKPPV